jgi:ubiquinone/menaquinone biosynthesis C-methylase UbiE
VRDYYEELWERLPEHLEPPHLQLRAAFARANVRPGDRVLDLGCGDGALTAVLADGAGARAPAPGESAADPAGSGAGAPPESAADPAGSGAGAPPESAAAGSVVGVDVAEAALRRARARHPGLTFALAPIDGPLPFDDGSFDLVWASEVIEHVADTARWLSEVRRVLVPRGRLLVTTPNHGRLQLAIGGIERYSEPLGDHLHLYSARSLRQLLTEFDFEVSELRSADGPPLVKRLLLASAVR